MALLDGDRAPSLSKNSDTSDPHMRSVAPVDADQRDRFWWWVLAAAAGFVVLIGLAFFVMPVLTMPDLGNLSAEGPGNGTRHGSRQRVSGRGSYCNRRRPDAYR